MYRNVLTTGLLVALAGVTAAGQKKSMAAAIDAYLQPYTQTANFAGDVLVEKKGSVIFEKAYGFADREHHIRNTPATRFHIASVSMQFTAAAVLRLVDAGALSLDEKVGDFVRGIEGADKITIRDLLVERSGLPDINALADYDDLLQHHQTPSSLIAKIEGKSLLFEPGSKYLHEEHSAYNLLALIVEKKTGLPFAAAVEKLVLKPLNLAATAADDDSRPQSMRIAKGSQPEGTFGLRAAKTIHWSAKTGNASVYTTAADEARFAGALFGRQFLSAASRGAVLDTSPKVGYGWFRAKNERFSETAYYMNGRAPGFASFVLYLPESQTTVVVLSNIYSSATTAIGYDVAALSLGLPYESLHVRHRQLGAAELKSCNSTFQFGSDFYQANANVAVVAKGKDLTLRWPSGDVSALIPLGPDEFMDRSYWKQVKIERDASGKPTALIYDHFRGTVSQP